MREEPPISDDTALPVSAIAVAVENLAHAARRLPAGTCQQPPAKAPARPPVRDPTKARKGFPVRHRASFPSSYRIHRWILAAVFAILLVIAVHALVVPIEFLVGDLLSGLRSAHLLGR